MRRFWGPPQTQGSDDLQRLFWTSSVSLFSSSVCPIAVSSSAAPRIFRWLFHVWAGGVQPRLCAIPQSSLLELPERWVLLLISFQFYLWINIF